MYYNGLAHSLGGQFFEQEHIVWFTTGRHSLMRFNRVLRTYPPAYNLSKAVKPVLDHFISSNLPFFWANFPPGAVPGLGEFLVSHKVPWLVRGMPTMQRSLEDLPALELPDDVEKMLVQTEQDRMEWLEVLMDGFPEPEEAREDFRHYLQRSLAKTTFVLASAK